MICRTCTNACSQGRNCPAGGDELYADTVPAHLVDEEGAEALDADERRFLTRVTLAGIAIWIAVGVALLVARCS